MPKSRTVNKHKYLFIYYEPFGIWTHLGKRSDLPAIAGWSQMFCVLSARTAKHQLRFNCYYCIQHTIQHSDSFMPIGMGAISAQHQQHTHRHNQIEKENHFLLPYHLIRMIWFRVHAHIIIIINNLLFIIITNFDVLQIKSHRLLLLVDCGVAKTTHNMFFF